MEHAVTCIATILWSVPWACLATTIQKQQSPLVKMVMNTSHHIIFMSSAVLFVLLNFNVPCVMLLISGHVLPFLHGRFELINQRQGHSTRLRNYRGCSKRRGCFSLLLLAQTFQWWACFSKVELKYFLFVIEPQTPLLLPWVHFLCKNFCPLYSKSRQSAWYCADCLAICAAVDSFSIWSIACSMPWFTTNTCLSHYSENHLCTPLLLLCHQQPCFNLCSFLLLLHESCLIHVKLPVLDHSNCLSTQTCIGSFWFAVIVDLGYILTFAFAFCVQDPVTGQVQPNSHHHYNTRRFSLTSKPHNQKATLHDKELVCIFSRFEAGAWYMLLSFDWNLWLFPIYGPGLTTRACSF